MQFRKDSQASMPTLDVWGITLPILMGTALAPVTTQAGLSKSQSTDHRADSNTESSQQHSDQISRLVIPGREDSVLSLGRAIRANAMQASDTLITDVAMIREDIPLGYSNIPLGHIGRMTFTEAEYQGHPQLRIRLKGSIKQISPADVILPAQFFDQNGCRMMALGDSDRSSAVHIPESARIEIRVFPGNRRTGRHVRFHIEIHPGIDGSPVEFLNFDTAPGNAPYKSVKVEIGEKRRNSDGNSRSYIRQVVDVRQVDLLEIRKSLDFATNS